MHAAYVDGREYPRAGLGSYLALVHSDNYVRKRVRQRENCIFPVLEPASFCLRPDREAVAEGLARHV
jgi:hypothetical protein